MSSKQRVTIALDRKIVKEIDQLSKEQEESRSHIIEEAIKFWGKRRREKELIEGYLAMSMENSETAEANLVVAAEVLS